MKIKNIIVVASVFLAFGCQGSPTPESSIAPPTNTQEVPAKAPKETVSLRDILNPDEGSDSLFKEPAQIEYDKFERIVFIRNNCVKYWRFIGEFSKESETLFCPFVAWEKGETPKVFIKIEYYGQDNFYLEGTKIVADDTVISRPLDWNPAHTSFIERLGTPRVRESRTVELTSDVKETEAFFAAQAPEARLIGKTGYLPVKTFDDNPPERWLDRQIVGAIYTRYKDAILVD